MGLIFYLSSRADYPSLLPSWWGDTQSIVAHLALYAVLALLWERALRTAGIRRPLLWAFVITTLYGASDEFHQHFVPGRSADGFDLRTDAVAAGLALGIAAWARQRGRIRVNARSQESASHVCASTSKAGHEMRQCAP